jgi:PTS system cellobiose-specific IIC component
MSTLPNAHPESPASTPLTPGRRIAAFLNKMGDEVHLASVRAGMVSIVPLTIIGGLFLVISQLPVPGWDTLVGPYQKLLEIPVTATFGVLSIFVCFAIAHELGRLLRQEPLVSASMATLVFLLIQIDPEEHVLNPAGLGSQGLFTAILVALISVRVQKFFTDTNLVVRLPRSVPPVVYESFVSLTPMIVLMLGFWLLRFVIGFDINAGLASLLEPLVFALNTLPGILVYTFLVTLLWSFGINGDNAMDAFVAAFFLQFLAANVEAATQGQPLPYITAYGFFTTFVNVGGTGATLGLALVLIFCREPGYRKVSRVSLPTQVFQINEPIFFGLPIVLNPVFMVPYVLSALTLTTSTYLLMDWGVISRPFVNVPWTTPPVIGHYLVTGGDWRAAVWGVASIGIAMAIYFPFARYAVRRRLAHPTPQIPTPQPGT